MKVVYNLLYYQVVVQISCSLSQAERSAILGRARVCEHDSSSLETIMSTIIGYFNDSKLYGNDPATSDAPVRRTVSSTSATIHFARVKIQTLEQQVGFDIISLIPYAITDYCNRQW